MSLDRRRFLRTAAAAAALLPGRIRADPDGSPLRAVVIGHTGRGDYGHGLERIFIGRPGIRTVALCDPDADGRERMATRLGIGRTYGDVVAMLAAEKPDLASVGMRHAEPHHAIVRACLEAGVHVYCEKPFVCTPAEADDLLTLATARGLRIAVAHTQRFNPALLNLAAALAREEFGALREIRAHGKQDTRAGGEDMMVLGSHLFDLMRWWAGDPLWCTARVLWQGRPMTRGDRRRVADGVGWVAGDSVFAQFAFPGGVDATFTSRPGLRPVSGPWGMELVTTGGRIRIDLDTPPTVFIARGATGREVRWEPLDPAVGGLPADHQRDPVGDWLDAIATGRDPVCSARNGAWAVEMVMAVYQASLTGGRVGFPLVERDHPLEG